MAGVNFRCSISFLIKHARKCMISSLSKVKLPRWPSAKLSLPDQFSYKTFLHRCHCCTISSRLIPKQYLTFLCSVQFSNENWLNTILLTY
jgi:hypothetical protein